ncbi:MAG: hypothetical protein K2J99_04785 [Lachnospiraceae bacterium]|nr:hypothetical protein [Lachnospiraceae bacterium]
MYVMGVDVGGSKTHCVVADENGKTIAEGFGGAGNYQVCGVETASDSMKNAVYGAVEPAGLAVEDIAYAVFGISGADGPEDFEVLTPMVQQIMGTTGHQIVHDAWIGLRAGTEDYVGVVSICGTGAGHAGRNRAGHMLTLRNLDFITGNYGGGGEIGKKAMHYAFRSEEGTWKKSRLEEAVPSVFGVKNMEEVCAILRRGEMTKQQRYQLPIIVFDLAREGDDVSKDIVSGLGYEEGKYAAAVLRRLGMCEEEVPAVLIGSIFQTNEPVLIDAYMRAVHEDAPNAYAVIPQEAPVTGAVKLALDYIRTSKGKNGN